MTPPEITVVGAGLAGLAAAAELAVTARVRLVERLPAPGGGWGFDHPAVTRLVATCERLGVELVMGVTALRWVDHRLLLVGPGVRRWVGADELVFAGGTRPATPAELALAGDRPAGVLSATVAHHLLEAGVVLGRHVVVHGPGDWVDVVVPQLLASGTVTVVGGPPGMYGAHPEVRTWPGFRPVRVLGSTRVRSVDIERRGANRTISCDALVLAAEPRPIRNVDGAIVDSHGVTFVQPLTQGLGAAEVVDASRGSVSTLVARRGAQR